jgi:hypothetical protein
MLQPISLAILQRNNYQYSLGSSSFKPGLHEIQVIRWPGSIHQPPECHQALIPLSYLILVSLPVEP